MKILILFYHYIYFVELFFNKGRVKDKLEFSQSACPFPPCLWILLGDRVEEWMLPYNLHMSNIHQEQHQHSMKNMQVTFLKSC